MTRYQVYKGAQKPIEFKGFKGKFIYQGLGGGFLILIICGVIMSKASAIYGAISLFTFLPGWLFYLAQKQKKGLANKKKTVAIIIYPNTKILNYHEKTTI